MVDVAVEGVLQRARDNVHAERMKRRDEIYSKRRKLVTLQNNGKPNENYTEEDVINSAQSLTKSTTDKEVILTALKNGVIQSPANLIAFVKVEGALHALVGHLMNHNSFIQLLAAECCCNLALGDSKSSYKLAKLSTPYLISILQGLNFNLMNVVLQTINNLCGSGPKTCQLLHSQGVVQALEKTISIPELRENTAKALIMITRNGSCFMSKEEMLHVLNNILPYFEDSHKVQWLTYLLSSSPYIIPVLLQNDIHSRVLRMLGSLRRIRSENIISVTSLVRMLGNLTADPEGVTANVMLDQWDTTLYIIKFFVASKYRHLGKEVYWSLGNILQHKSPQVQNKVKLRTRDDMWHEIRSVLSEVAGEQYQFP